MMLRSHDRIRRFLQHPVFLGIAALLWLIFRSGQKPSRLAYPCQQAAFSTTTLILVVPLAAALIRLFRRLSMRITLAVPLGVLIAGVILDPRDTPSVAGGAQLDPPQGYVASLYLVGNAGGPQPDGHHGGFDTLIQCMADGGLIFYRSTSGWPGTSPNGIIGANDVVLIKVNQQWSQRGGTNTDVLRGIIRRIVEHPDGFVGEVVVVENTQGRGSLDWPQSNAEDHGHSVMDVVNGFVVEGWVVSTYLWDTVRTRSVGEYSEGDLLDGYVVNPAQDPDTRILVSYPKFQTASGNYVSLKHGLWDSGTGSYDDSRLTFLNVPILKCHSGTAVTACLKHHVGTMTTALGTDTHGGVRRGGCGSFLAEVRMPDLNILDCIYILARPGSGPACSYASATRVDRLVAAVDPVALDIWAVKNILIPTIIENGYPQDDYRDTQDPDNPSSVFRTYLDRSMDELLRAGIDVTNDLAQITVHTPATAVQSESWSSIKDKYKE
jgi:hypothetical protein